MDFCVDESIKYYVVEDLKAAPLNVIHFDKIDDAIKQYQSYTQSSYKNLVAFGINKGMSSIDLVHFKRGLNYMLTDYTVMDYDTIFGLETLRTILATLHEKICFDKIRFWKMDMEADFVHYATILDSPFSIVPPKLEEYHALFITVNKVVKEVKLFTTFDGNHEAVQEAIRSNMTADSSVTYRMLTVEEYREFKTLQLVPKSFSMVSTTKTKVDYTYSFTCIAPYFLLILNDLMSISNWEPIGGRSLTNGMLDVLHELEGVLKISLSGKPIIYKDSDGIYSEVMYQNGASVTYKNLTIGKLLRSEKKAIAVMMKKYGWN